jgi:nucleotide-binding universal stress UspA family protein
MRLAGYAVSYKTILVHVDKSRNASERIKLAAALAMNENAHVIGAALTGVSRYIYHAGLISDIDPDLTTHMSAQLDLLRERAKDALREFEAIALAMHIRSVETELVDDEAGAGISLQARCSDLVVIGQTDLNEPSPAVMPDFPEYVLMHSGRPVLIVPHTGRFDKVGNRVLVAWDASIGATHAVTNAIPLLTRAGIVEVAIFNADSQDDAHGPQPGADIAQYLARHDIKVDVINRKTEVDIGDALLSLAVDLASDLIVMGGYGHSRFREILLGGVTRTVLESMTVPVMMSH